jgi:hypothetical protein
MEETILTTVKRDINGLTEENHDFDDELLDHINTYLRFCNRFGIGAESFCATVSSTWSDFLGEDVDYYSAVKTYITLKIKYWWDPPTVGAAVNAIQETLKEIEFDLMIRRECPESFGHTVQNDEPDDPYEDG